MRLSSCRLFGGSRQREGSVWRFRVPILCGASVLLATVVPIVLVGGVQAAAAADPSVETCPGTGSGTPTFTLTANCDTTAALTVPNGVTLNGAGHTITAHDTTPGTPSIDGAVLSNAGTSMNVENLTIMGNFTPGFPGCRGTLNGIEFDGAGGTVANVTVTGISEHTGNCQVGRAIVANGAAGQTLTITDTTVTDYQKSAIQATGMTMNVSGSIIGAPKKAPIGQNGLLYLDGSTGTTSGSTINGSGFGSDQSANAAVLMIGANNVTLTDDTITGKGTDLGVAVHTSTGVIIDRNQIGRTAPDVPDSFGFGVEVEPGPATVTCNTFSGWKSDFNPAGSVTSQPVCVTTTTLPDGTVKVPYSAKLTAVGGTAPYTWSRISGSLPPGLALAANGAVTGTPTKEGIYDFTVKVTDAKGQTAIQALTIVISAPPSPPKTQGYWLTAGDGGVFTFGSAAFRGSAAKVPLVAPVVGIATTPNGAGYWLGAKDGGVFSYGLAFHGSLGKVHLAAPIVAIAATPDGQGYYLVGADGGVFTFGDAHFHGSAANVHLAAPIVGMAVTRDGGGYYLVGKDGGVFSFGDARFHGSLGATALNTPIAGIAVDNATQGYWLVGANGSLYVFGAPTFGSVANVALHAPVVGIASTQDGLGYRFVASDGGVFCFGNAHFLGSMGGKPLNQPAVGMTSVG